MTESPKIVERSFAFALRVVKLCQVLQKTPGTSRTIGAQLLRSGTSIGANVEEAQAAQSRADFICKMSISLKESRETVYWLRIIRGSELVSPAMLDDILAEANTVTRIIGAIVRTTRKNPDTKSQSQGRRL